MKNIWVPLSGQIAQERKVETIANNIANANTPGFKKDRLVFKEHLTALDKGIEDINIPRREWAPKDFYHSHGAENAHVKVDGSYTVFEQGQLGPTNNPFDIGLQGKGFFEVLTPNGIRFSRKGNFNISKDGELVTDKGFKVLAHFMAPGNQGRIPGANLPTPEQRVIKIPSSTKSFNIDMEGNIYADGNQVSKLSIVEFNDLHALKKEGTGLFINNMNNNLVRGDQVTTKTHQGFIEQSNVNAVKEMSELIKAQRHFESIQKAIKTYDDISGRAVNDISRF